MTKNCISLFSENDFMLLKNTKNEDELYENPTKYKSILESLSEEELKIEYSQNQEIFNSLKYAYDYIKSFYYVNVVNYAKGVSNDELYCNINNQYNQIDEKDALTYINTQLKLIYEFIDKHTKSIIKYKTNYPRYVYFNHSINEGETEDKLNEHSLLKDTYRLACDCLSYYGNLCYLYDVFYNTSVLNKIHINNSVLTEEEKKITDEFPKSVLGKNEKERIDILSESNIAFEIYNPEA